jgi:phage baseplate assembly protein W
MARAIDVPHIAFPMRLDAAGALVTNEQDSLDEVQQCVLVLLRTPLGARPLAPGVGVADPTFTDGIDPEALTATLTNVETGEPRADVQVTVQPVDQAGRQPIAIAIGLADDARGIDPDSRDTL